MSVDELASDYKEYIGIVEALLNLVNDTITQYCQMRGSSLPDELASAREGIDRNNEGQKRESNLLYMHAFDFKTWFQTKVWRTLKDDQNIPFDMDMEVVNLVVLYLSNNPKQPDNIYLPMFYERNQIEDLNILGESQK